MHVSECGYRKPAALVTVEEENNSPRQQRRQQYWEQQRLIKRLHARRPVIDGRGRIFRGELPAE